MLQTSRRDEVRELDERQGRQYVGTEKIPRKENDYSPNGYEESDEEDTATGRKSEKERKTTKIQKN